MARVFFFVVMLALTIYAAADWHRTPEDEMPGKLPKPIWLLIILFTATIAAIGPSRPTTTPSSSSASNATSNASAAKKSAASASKAKTTTNPRPAKPDSPTRPARIHEASAPSNQAPTRHRRRSAAESPGVMS